MGDHYVRITLIKNGQEADTSTRMFNKAEEAQDCFDYLEIDMILYQE
jgi:hypothetical protein